MIDGVLRRYWPEETQTMLLIAALGDPPDAAASWQQWLSCRDLDHASWAEIRLLATVARRIAQFKNSPALPLIQGIRKFVWTRTQLCLRKTRPLVSALRNAGIRVMLIKGTARLAFDPSCAADRFINDVDILVDLNEWSHALDVVYREGWRTEQGCVNGLDGFPHVHAYEFRKPGPGTLEGAVDLHHFALHLCRNVDDDDRLWARSVPATLLGIDLLVPCPTDQLLLTLGHGLHYNTRPVADWALDAAALVRSGAIDWDLLEEETRRRQIDPYIASTLTFLKERLGLFVPPSTLTRITDRVREPFLTEFNVFATAPHPSDEKSIDRVREAASMRAYDAASRNTATQVNAASRVLSLMRLTALPSEGNRVVTFRIPQEVSPVSLLRLEVGFTMDEVPQGKRVGIEIAAPGMLLKRWLSGQSIGKCEASQLFPRRLAFRDWLGRLNGPIASIARLGLWKTRATLVIARHWWYRLTRRPLSARHVVYVEMPAALFQRRRIRSITLRALGRWLIEDVSVRLMVSD